MIRIADGGAIIAEGSTYGRTLHPEITTTDASPPVSSFATLDGASFTSGDAVSGAGGHTLVVTASDALGNSATTTLHFSIDLTPPRFLSLSPPDGTLTAAAQITIRAKSKAPRR